MKEPVDIYKYEFQLPEKYKEMALQELREDDNRRLQALEQFKEWILKNPNIKRCPEGKPHLFSQHSWKWFLNLYIGLLTELMSVKLNHLLLKSSLPNQKKKMKKIMIFKNSDLHFNDFFKKPDLFADINPHHFIFIAVLDAVFLLRFLRPKKFSVQQACEMFENGLFFRQLYPTLFTELDILSPKLSALFDCGYLTALPERDELGRQIVIARVSSIDPNGKFSAFDIMKLNIIIFGYLLGEEETQIGGFVYIVDNSQITMKHASILSFTEIKLWTQMIHTITPARMKEIHMINLPHFTAAVLEFFLKFLSKKL